MTALAWTGAALMWSLVLAAVVLIWRHLAGVRHHRHQDALTRWARWTTLTIIGRDGAMTVISLAQMFERHRRGRPIEQVWAEPLSVALWTADRADLYRAWHEAPTVPPEQAGG